MVGLSSKGYKNGAEMTSREQEDLLFRAKSLWFNSEREFQIYSMTHKYPLGPCIIGSGRNERRYDDTAWFA